MAAFLVAQPFRAAEESPDVAGAIGYCLPLHRVPPTPFAGLKPRGYERRRIPFGLMQETRSRTDSRNASLLRECP